MAAFPPHFYDQTPVFDYGVALHYTNGCVTGDAATGVITFGPYDNYEEPPYKEIRAFGEAAKRTPPGTRPVVVRVASAREEPRPGVALPRWREYARRR